MVDDDSMASRLKNFKSLVSQLESSLKTFQNSESKFQVLKTVHPSNPYSPQEPSATIPPNESPKTLYILDSSFNPPSIAHGHIAKSALHKSSTSGYPGPYRLLLLFATMNADKAPSAASFHQRLTLMTIFAGDLLTSLQSSSADHEVVPIDIGVTPVPYYTDKSVAIEAEGYPSKPKHIHLIGFDTVTRFFNPKYYQSFDPPLSALNAYFDQGGHRLRATLRPDDEYGTVEEQRGYIRRLADGEMEKDGGKREWAGMIDLVDPNPEAGVSSTRIRNAAKRGDWDELGGLCTETVAAWVREERLYEDDDQGAKMA